ncbi:mechanosensitive ion channel family protein [Roseisalinus antarcticus]|uniref:Small-conductance mechanosensitive channel n=1 Tax=Roseisalinus antarcticus TaxID=254357 RepID=A0A1Y5U0T5_9RHOB|nr:mechanosensitive ion channel family protein [Roseisalinus antarcticus]SLN75752.1 Small-conductance mechanosensitive channel [Roseisalinus antarcticus]
MRFLHLLLLLAALVAPLPGAAQDAGPNGPITAQTDAISDAAIAVRIREIIAELGGYEDVTVTVSEGIVRLRGTTTSMTEAGALEGLVNRVEGVVAIRNEVTETADIIRRLDPAIERFRARMAQLVVSLPLLLIAGAVSAVIVSLGFALARWQRPWERLAPNAFIADLYRVLIRLAFIVVAIVVALDILNASALLSTILGAAGIIGLAVGFAVRDTVENFIASIMLSIRQPFGPNDVVEINGDQGKVIRLTSRATILLSFDGNQIRIPNATVFKSRIVNYSINPEMRFTFTICVDLMSDLSEVVRIAKETISGLPYTLSTPAPMIWLGEITDSGVEVIVAGWIDQRDTSLLLARGEALRQLKRAYVAAGIDMPNTTYTIALAGGDLAAPDTSSPAPHRSPLAAEPDDIAPVAETTAGELDRIVDAEREQEDAQDLLRPEAAKE